MSNQGFFNFVMFNGLLLFLPLAALALWLKPRLWLSLLTFFLGVIVGWLDFKSTEVSLAVLLLLTFGFFTGYAHPRRALLSALLLGMWVPILGFVGRQLGLNQATPIELVTSLLALVFSFAGAFTGLLVRRFAAPEAILAGAS